MINPARTPFALSGLFLDLGNVLLQFDWGKALKTLALQTTLKAPALWELIAQAPEPRRYETGELSSGKFFNWLAERTRYGGTTTELEQAWNDIFDPLPENLDAARKLKGKLPLFLASNTNEAHIRFLKERYDFFNWFDDCFFSYQLGVRKPHSAFYEEIIRRTACHPATCLFVDDMADNVAGARKAGFRTLLFQTSQTTLTRELDMLGINMD